MTKPRLLGERSEPHYERLNEEDIRRRDAMNAFLQAEEARRKLVRANRFYMAVALLGIAFAIGVLLWAP